MARPTNDPKNYRIDLRINEETNNKLQEISKQSGITIAEYIRKLIYSDLQNVQDQYGHKERVLHLRDTLLEAKIYAGAEFEVLCNDGEHKEAVIFELIRDTLQAQRVVLSDYITSVKYF